MVTTPLSKRMPCCSCHPHKFAITTTCLTWIVWAFVTFVFVAGLIDSLTTREDNHQLASRPKLIASTSDQGHKSNRTCANTVPQNYMVYSMVTPLAFSITGLITDSITLWLILRGNGSAVVPVSIFYGCTGALLGVVFVATNAYFCQEATFLINIIVPIILALFVIHWVSIYIIHASEEGRKIRETQEKGPLLEDEIP